MKMLSSTLSILAILVPVALTTPTEAAGPLAGWGYNKFDQINVPAGTFTAVAAGNYHSLAIRSDSTLVGWGYNGFGQNNVPAGTFTAIAAFANHSLAIRSDGTLSGWGENPDGLSNVPSDTFSAVATGLFHSLAIRGDGTLVGWGSNQYDQINVPKGTFTLVAAGNFHSLAIRGDGTLVGWGRNDDGQIDTPSGVFTAVAAGSYHSLAVRRDGTLVGWGRNEDGQIDTPSGVFTAVAAGAAHSLAIRSNGTLAAWGLNNVGQITIPSGAFTSVTAGYLHSLGIRLVEKCDIPPGTGPDCNFNDVPDECEIADGTAPDCNANAVPDPCDIDAGTSPDCNISYVPDECDIAAGTALDCNSNSVPDICDLAFGPSVDCNFNDVPDECEIAGGVRDCNLNGVPDACDIAFGTTPDCNSNTIPDSCDIATSPTLDCNTNAVPDSCDLSAGTSEDRNENGVPDECDQCPVIDLARLRAVPAWDIEFTRSTTNSASGGGALTLPSNPSIIGFSLDYETTFVYSFRVTVAGDCTTQSMSSLPCRPLLSPENPGELRVEREDLLDGWEVNYVAASGPSCLCDTPQESTYSQQVRRTTTGGVVFLDGTPEQFVRGGFGIDTSVCPPRGFASISAFPGFPVRLTSRSCRSCESRGLPAGCQTEERDLPGSIYHYVFLDFGEEEHTWLTEPEVRMENGRFVIRGQDIALNSNSPCIDDHFLCGFIYDPICSATNVSGTRAVYTSVLIREHEAPPPPLAIHSVEFTQGIQVLQPLELLKADLVGDGSPPVPIVAGKPAVMRVYFDQVTDPANFILEINGGPITGSRTGIVSAECAPEDQRRQERACFGQDFYFTPPEGPWSVTLTLKDGGGIEQESHVLNLTSKKSDAIVLKAVSVCHGVDANGNWECASGSALQLLVGLLKKIAPTDEIVVVNTGHQVKGRVVTTVNGINNDGDLYDCIDDNANGIDDLGDRCEARKWWDLVADAIHELANAELGSPVPGRQSFYYGMVRPAVPGGVLGIAVLSGRGAASKTLSPLLGFELAPWVVAHETAHMLGRDHTNTDQPPLVTSGCWLGPSDAPTWPYADNWVQSGAPPGVIEIGFDVQARTALDPRDAFDVMGYCAGSNWISPHTTLGLLDVLAPSPAAAAAQFGQTGSYWRVSGTIQGGAGTINPIFTIDTQGSLEPGAAAHRIEVLDAGGIVLFTRFFTPTAPHISPGPDGPVPDGTPFFSELIPVQAIAASIALRDSNGTTLAQVSLGGTAPIVDITFPNGGELFQHPETATWTVTDPDSTNHMFQVQYSADGGATWRSLTSAESALSLVVDFSDLPGSVGQSLLRVSASDGVNTGMAVSNAFSVAKKQPSARIISPSPDGGFALGTLVLLQALAFDPDEGLLTGASLHWSSDADGQLGSGNDLPVYTLSRGRHTLILSVTDSDGNIATDQVTVSVFDEPTADADFDGDVDLNDFGSMGRCFAGPRVTPSAPACRAFDFDADGDVDVSDLAAFQNCVSGANVLADPNCLK